MNPERLLQLIQSFASKRILVIGDLILDEFVWGRVRRISPEAPVPVVEVDRETYYPGGAANVARNLREFGTRTGVLGMVGPGAHAAHLLSLLSDRLIDTSSVMAVPDFQTIVKTRIIARQQQVVRVDRERRQHLTESEMGAALAKVENLLADLDAVVIEDYGKGMLEQDFVTLILAAARKAGVPVAVDPTPSNPLSWKGATTITPNRLEAFAAAGLPWSEPVEPALEDAALLEAGTRLLKEWECDNLLVTLSEQGMMLFRPGREPFHIPTRAREVFDVSGAGDTSIALFTLALVSGAAPEEAADIANHAAGVVVGKLGTATVTPDELLSSFKTAGA